MAQQSKSVLINECIVRALYFIRSLYKEITTKNIKSLKDLNKIEIKNILPFNSRNLKRMLTISNGVFVLVDLSKAVIKSGGTAILSGGGALIGLASPGVTSLAYTTTNMSNKFILQECAKLLTFCKVWIIDNKQDKKAIIKIKESIEDLIEKFNINLAKEKDKKIIPFCTKVSYGAIFCTTLWSKRWYILELLIKNLYHISKKSYNIIYNNFSEFS